VSDWLDSWTKTRRLRPLKTAGAAHTYATRTRHAADLALKPPVGASWKEVAEWLRQCGERASGQEVAKK
jgi:hypothetical protein